MGASFLYNRMFYTCLRNVHLRNKPHGQTVLNIHEYLTILDIHTTRWKKMFFIYFLLEKTVIFLKSWHTSRQETLKRVACEGPCDSEQSMGDGKGSGCRRVMREMCADNRGVWLIP